MEDKEKSIIAFVSKLIDRNTQKQRENGFTIYAILAGMIYLSIFLLDNAAIIFESKSFFSNNFVLFVSVINFAPVVYYVWHLFKVFFNDQTGITIQPRLFRKYNHYTLISACIFIFLLLVFNVIAFMLLENKNQNNIYLLIFIFYYSIMIVAAIYKPYKLWQNEKKNPNIERTDYYVFQKTKGNIIITIIYGALFSTLNILFIKEILIFNSDIEVIITIKYSIYFLGFLFLALLIFESMKRVKKTKWLEDLEKDIYLNKLKYDQIAERLEKDYFGYSVDKKA